MAADAIRDSGLQIAHVLFIDIIGYSKLLVNQQTELLRLLNDVVRTTEQFRAAEAAKAAPGPHPPISAAIAGASAVVLR